MLKGRLATIEQAKLLKLTTHSDTRGFFREVLRASDMPCEFAQLSHSMMYTDTIKAWHWHSNQHDLWYVPSGVILAAVCQLDENGNQMGDVGEFILGDNQAARVLHIPPYWAHGLKVLQAPAHLIYATSQEYNPDDEHRIPYDALDYDWLKSDIR